MRTARFLAAIVAPMIIVACAVANDPTPEGTGSGDGDGGTTTSDSSYGGNDSATSSGNDAGVSSKDSGAAPKDGGVTPPVDSGGGGLAGQDCVGKTSSSGESYDSECDDLLSSGDESDCSKGGGECGAGTCCRSSTECNNFFLGDFLFPQCVPQ